MKLPKMLSVKTAVQWWLWWKNCLGRKKILWPIKASFSLLICYYLFTLVDIGELWSNAVKINVKYFLVIVLLFIANHLFLTYKWKYTLSRLGTNVSLFELFQYNVLGHASGLVLPSRLGGDLVKFVGFVKTRKQHFVVAVSMIIEKVAVFIAILAFSFFGLMQQQTSTMLMPYYVLACVLLLLSLIVFFILCFFRGDKLPKFLRMEYAGFLYQIIKKLRCLPRFSLKEVLFILIQAFLSQFGSVIGGIIFLKALGIHLESIVYIYIHSLANVSELFPLSLNGLGVKESVFVFLMNFHGVTPEEALAFSLVGVGVNYIMTVILFASMPLIKIVREKIYFVHNKTQCAY